MICTVYQYAEIKPQQNQHNILINKEFFNEYFNDIVDIFLLSNIGSISYTNAPEYQRIILNQVTDLYKLPENGSYKLTYQLEDNKFSDVDSSFEKNSPYYSVL